MIDWVYLYHLNTMLKGNVFQQMTNGMSNALLYIACRFTIESITSIEYNKSKDEGSAKTQNENQQDMYMRDTTASDQATYQQGQRSIFFKVDSTKFI